MFANSKDAVVTIRGVPYKKHIILADVNIPYKFTIDRSKNSLFFCMNADDFSEQSFHSVVLNLDTGSAGIVPGLRNGFASAVDQNSGSVFLGGSDGIYTYSYATGDVEKPALIGGIDIFDMYYNNDLYFVDTSTQSLHVYKNGKNKSVPDIKGHLIHHFVIDGSDNIFFVNSVGLFMMRNGKDAAISLDDGEIHYRGATVDAHGVPHFIAQDGIYAINEQTRQVEQLLPLENGFGLAFDKENSFVYSDERSVFKLTHL